jgi:hypothetical protein
MGGPTFVPPPGGSGGFAYSPAPQQRCFQNGAGYGAFGGGTGGVSRKIPPGFQPPPPHAPLSPEQEHNLQVFTQAKEINAKFLPCLRRLVDYDVVLVCDDSGSMSRPADDEVPNVTRWMELKQSVNIILEAQSALGHTTDIYFLNRGVYRNVSSMTQLRQVFDGPPGGWTPTVPALQHVFQDHVRPDMPRPLIVHVFTDGHPTDAEGNEDIYHFDGWLRGRRMIHMTYMSLLLCTAEEEIV